MDVENLRIDRSAGRSRKRGSKRRGLPLWPLLLIAAAAGVWLFWSPLQRWLDAVRLPQVRVLRITASSASAVGAVEGTASNGYVVAARRAALSADTPGRIVELNVTEGSVVKEGEVVAKLFADEYEASLRRCEADVVAADAALGRARASKGTAATAIQQRRQLLAATKGDVDAQVASLRLAVAQLERATQLVASELQSQERLDRARSAHDEARARVAATKARVAAAEAAVLDAEAALEVAKADIVTAEAQGGVARVACDLARATLEKTNVRAPFDGVVVLKDAEVGEVVSPNSQGGSNARGSVCTMVDFQSLEIQADVPEQNLAAVTVGAPAQVFLDAWPDRSYSGKVDRIWPTADRQKATVEVRIKLDALDERLRPEMGVRVVFRAAEESAAQPVAGGEPEILIPADCLVDADGGGAAVFVVQRDVATLTAIQIGARRSSRVVVESGLQVDQRIIIQPPGSLRDGDRVRILQ